MQAEKKTIKSNIGKAIFFTSNESCDKVNIFFTTYLCKTRSCEFNRNEIKSLWKQCFYCNSEQLSIVANMFPTMTNDLSRPAAYLPYRKTTMYLCRVFGCPAFHGRPACYALHGFPAWSVCPSLHGCPVWSVCPSLHGCPVCQTLSAFLVLPFFLVFFFFLIYPARFVRSTGSTHLISLVRYS